MTDTIRPTRSAINSLIAGYQEFRRQHFEESKAYDALVAYGQNPKILTIACCDSRVDPAIVTGCKPGELFVARNVANLVPPFDSDPRHHGTSAALEFAVMGLGVSDIIVFGHSHCGGIRALMEAPSSGVPSDFIASWMNIAQPAKQQVLTEHPEFTLDQQAHQCEKRSLFISLDNLMTFPWIKERVLSGQLFLHLWYFNLSTGMIEAYQKESDTFEPLAAS